MGGDWRGLLTRTSLSVRERLAKVVKNQEEKMKKTRMIKFSLKRIAESPRELFSSRLFFFKNSDINIINTLAARTRRALEATVSRTENKLFHSKPPPGSIFGGKKWSHCKGAPPPLRSHGTGGTTSSSGTSSEELVQRRRVAALAALGLLGFFLVQCLCTPLWLISQRGRGESLIFKKVSDELDDE